VVDPARRDFAEEIRTLVERYTGGPKPGAGSPADALVQVAARMADRVAERINRAPDKNFAAFLDLLGLERRPPQPARVPLAFTLAAGARDDALVPAGTQVEAAKLEGETAPVVFETEEALVVTRSELVRVFSRDPARDAWGEHTAASAAGETFPAFGADQPAEHLLFLDLSPLLEVSGPKSLALALETGDRSLPWPRWAEWALVQPDGTPLPLRSRWDERGWRVLLPGVPDAAPATVEGRTGRWLRARLAAPDGTPLPLRWSGVAPDALLPAAEAGGAVRPFAPAAAGETGTLLVASELFGMPGARLWLEVEPSSPGIPTSDELSLAWEYARADGSWAELGRSGPQGGSGEGGVEDGTGALARPGRVAFTAPGDWARGSAGRADGFWLRARVASGSYAAGADPAVARVSVGREIAVPALRGVTACLRARQGGIPLPAAAFNHAPLDLGKDFFPLGEIPRFGDAFHLCLPGIADKPGAEVRVDVLLTNPADESALPRPARPTDDLVLRWEFWSARTGRWEMLGESGPGVKAGGASPYGFHDGTEALAAREGGTRRISFTRPDEMGETTVAGVRGSWIRARVAAGGYGTEARWVEDVQVVEYVVPAPAAAGAPGDAPAEAGNPAPAKGTAQRMEIPTQRLVPADHRPPSVHAVTVGYRDEAGPVRPARVLASDDRRVRELGMDGGAFVPFEAESGDPALYLGFLRPGSRTGFGNRAVTLYVGVEEARDDGTPAPSPPAPRVAWEYWNGRAWTTLEARDGTAGLTRRGTVTFLGPADFAASRERGTEAFWLRARLAGGGYPAPPRIARVLPNAVWAREGETVQAETLGSANGERGMAFRAARTPVLDAVLEVREPVEPPAAEAAALAGETGPGAVRPVPEDEGRPGEHWVRWTRVADFHASGPRSRHYTLDWETGEVRFGDGTRGMIPPTGTGNVRLSRYRTGGGTRGNRPAGNVAQLRSTLPYVDAASNPEPAAGGAEGEAMPSLVERGPRWLRHRGRAVAGDDFADLAMEASPAVARARVRLPATAAEAGVVRVMIVPRGTEDRPVPTLELLDRVRDYLVARCTPTAEVRVTGPSWLRAEVEVQVAPRSLDAAQGLAAAVEDALRAFLHPLTGGPDGRGWEPGRRPYKSELYALVEGTPGVDFLRSLRVRYVEEATGLPPVAFGGDGLLVFPGAQRVTLAACEAD
jgi:predicted phage baseplate assembly protein